ncbi:MAG: pyridoxal phosphate-dependent aminotransferase [Burkholderiaceae bacterium]|nr:pyridoxal phosphate-dependent aminotransferase [Burkholderiaceae bacterium]MBP7661133.1 pyridoxal phosphate-dependent aminotransferase [Burkholderiaceae bacterium]
MPAFPPEIPSARLAVRNLPVSRIREVANAGIGNPDVLAFWFGEPDGVTPAFIRSAAAAALDAGSTFYSHNLGIAPLREALSRYLGRWHRPVSAERIAVTSAGVNALMLAAQLIISPGDRVVAVVPLWPNVTEIPRILGAEVERVPLHPDAQGRWVLDLERLLQAMTPGTRAVIINSPGNPTGWVMPKADMSVLLDHARRMGIWIISDEAYERLVFNDDPQADGRFCAPSLLDIADPQDRVIVANTFSKAWQMTGWRLGWLVVPPSLLDDLGKLIEFNTSCAPGFVQQAAVAALEEGEPHVRAFVQELRLRRDTLLAALATVDGLSVGSPEGAMYLFFKVSGVLDSLALAKDLVREAGLGLAPGSAFGPEGEGYLRWCFAKPAPMLEEGARRLRAHLQR